MLEQIIVKTETEECKNIQANLCWTKNIFASKEVFQDFNS